MENVPHLISRLSTPSFPNIIQIKELDSFYRRQVRYHPHRLTNVKSMWIVPFVW